MRPLATYVLSMLLALLAATAGCSRASDSGNADSASMPASVQGPRDSTSVMIDSINYMHERSTKYTLYDLSKSPPQAIGGAIVDRLGTGGEKGCCIALPNSWRSGMKVRLDWHESDRDKIYEEHSRELEIPRYDTPADLYVVFYPEQKVELVVSGAEPGHPDWRGQNKKTPWEQCIAAYGRKPCKAALPKQFDVESSQGFCSYLQEKKDPEAETLCLSATVRCMKDFEDESFCNKILWGARRK